MSTAILTADLSTRGGTRARYSVRPAGRGVNPRVLAELYGCRLDKEHEAGLAVTPDQMASRLDYDAESVLVGFLNDVPIGQISIAKLRLASLDDLPPTHQAVTANDTFSNTDPVGATTFVCVWVTQTEGAGKYRQLLEGEKTLSPAQLLIMAAKRSAQEHGVAQVIAYSRPSRLRIHLSEIYRGSPVQYTPDQDAASAKVTLLGVRLIADRCGFIVGEYRIFSLFDYWEAARARVVEEPVYRMHAQLGAEFMIGRASPFGNIHDGNSLGFRTPLLYRVNP